jgi:hypothetical protein
MRKGYILLYLLFVTGMHSFAQKTVIPVTAFDDSLLYGGCWFIPHNAGINIRFTGYANFVFNDYDQENGRELTLTGKYLLDGHNLWLIFNDRPKQKFYFAKEEKPGGHYYFRGYPLKTSTYYFVHGNCE